LPHQLSWLSHKFRCEVEGPPESTVQVSGPRHLTSCLPHPIILQVVLASASALREEGCLPPAGLSRTTTVWCAMQSQLQPDMAKSSPQFHSDRFFSRLVKLIKCLSSLWFGNPSQHSSCFCTIENNGNYPLNNQFLHFTFNLRKDAGPTPSVTMTSLPSADFPWCLCPLGNRKPTRMRTAVPAYRVLAISLKQVKQFPGDPDSDWDRGGGRGSHKRKD
jgi:hypothetical protein